MKKRFILHALKVQNLTHIPGAYYTSLTTRNAITFYFKHVPRVVLKEGSKPRTIPYTTELILNRVKEVYKNYFLDFVMFNYTINEFLVTAVDDYGTVAIFTKVHL